MASSSFLSKAFAGLTSGLSVTPVTFVTPVTSVTPVTHVTALTVVPEVNHLKIAAKNYINKILTHVTNATSKQKILILDNFTLKVISMLYMQSELTALNVTSCNTLHDIKKNVSMKDISALVFIQPTKESVNLLKIELNKPNYNHYYLFFTNVITTQIIDEIATSDRKKRVKTIKEYFLEYIPDDKVFTLYDNYEDPTYNLTIVPKLSTVLLSLKYYPVICYQDSSPVCLSIAKGLLSLMINDPILYGAGRKCTPPIVLVIDRMIDPITPLLTDISYVSLIHEFVVVSNGTYKISDQEYTLSPEHDDFYFQNMNNKWETVCENIKRLGERAKTLRAMLDTDSLKNTHLMPDYLKAKDLWSKHITLMQEIKEGIKRRNLIDIYKLERDILDNSVDNTTIISVIDNPLYELFDKLRLIIIYFLMNPDRFNSDIVSIIQQKGINIDKIARVLKSRIVIQEKSIIKDYIGLDLNFSNLLGSKRLSINSIVNNINKGNFDNLTILNSDIQFIPDKIVVFVVGGVTIAEISDSCSMRVTVGGDYMINSRSFIDKI